jgi:phosphoribosyl-ATP pyrophosphohydrolase/phosphoribosyl-AMP cyclohydrolase
VHEVKSGEVSLDAWVEGLKWDDKGFVVAIAQDVDTGAVLMQAFANREAVKATVKTKLGTFYSRSRKSLWCKGESSGNLLHVKGVYADCDGDSLIYLCKPVGPACHTGAPTCWFESVSSVRVDPGSDSDSADMVHLSRETPYGTLQVLENTIQARQDEISANNEKPSWTAKLLTDEALLLSKVREEAGELCETLERNEGKERTASEMADLLYHAMVLLRTQDVDLAQVLEILRGRFAISGIEEKAARPPKK